MQMNLLKTSIVYSQEYCTACIAAKRLLHIHGYEVEERKIGDGFTREDLLEAVPTARTVPQIFLDDKLIGGFTELRQHLKG